MPSANIPPGPRFFSKSVTQWPARLSCCVAASPAARAHNGHFLPRTLVGGFGNDPAFGPSAIDNRFFDGLDRDRIFVDTEDAGSLARRGTDAAGKLGEIVGGVQLAQASLQRPR